MLQYDGRSDDEETLWAACIALGNTERRISPSAKPPGAGIAGKTSDDDDMLMAACEVIDSRRLAVSSSNGPTSSRC